MYNIIKKVILSGRFELTDVLRKIDTLWIQGDLIDAEKTELEKLARENADEKQTIDMLKMIQDIDKRLRILEGLDKPEKPPVDIDPEYPLFDKDKGYRKGDKVTENGKKYICKGSDMTDVIYFGPLSYPAYWEEVI